MTGRKLVPLFIAAVVVYTLAKLLHILVPFVLSAAIAYALNPLIVYLEIQGVKREKAVILVYISLICIFGGLAYVGIAAGVESASNLGDDIPDYLQHFREFVRVNTMALDEISWLPHGIGSWIRGQVGQDSHVWLLSLVQKIPALFKAHVVPFAELALLVPFLVFFFMLDGPSFLDQLLDFVPARYVEMTLNVVLEINYSFGNYLRGIMVQAFFMGILAGIGYWVIGLHYAVYIAFWVAVTSMIPLLGPISAALAGGMVALFQWGTVAGFLKVLAIYGAIRFLDDWMLQPMILRRAVHIHPVLVVFTLMAGGYLGGLWGLLFAVPIACMLKVLIEVGWQWYCTEYGFRSLHTSAEIAQIPVV